VFVSCRQHFQYFGKSTPAVGDRVSAVGIATVRRLDGRGSESRWGDIFRAVEAHPASCTGSFSGVKLSERGADHSSSAFGLRVARNYASTFPLCLHRLVMV